MLLSQNIAKSGDFNILMADITAGEFKDFKVINILKMKKLNLHNTCWFCNFPSICLVRIEILQKPGNLENMVDTVRLDHRCIILQKEMNNQNVDRSSPHIVSACRGRN